MRVVVTGSAGRIGRAIFVRLAREHEVIGIDRVPASAAVRYVGDVADRRLLAAAFEGAQAVVHVAALLTPHVGIVPDGEFERVNIGGTEAVLAAARRAGIRRIVFTSTTAVYGHANTSAGAATWIDENVIPCPRTVYHRTKLAAEQLLRDAADRDLQIRILRMSRCFPEPADLMAIYRIHRGIDARDVAAAHAAALVHTGEPHHTWVISGATPFKNSDRQDLAENAPAVLRVRAPDLVAAYENRGWRLPQTIDRIYVPMRAMHDLGWRPRYSFQEVLSMLDQESAEVLPPARHGPQ
jgi:UDP-glucose 4-epimerase